MGIKIEDLPPRLQEQVRAQLEGEKKIEFRTQDSELMVALGKRKRRRME